MKTSKIISYLSLLAGLCLFTMFLIAIFTGVSQEKFEISQPIENYTKGLIAGENSLRLTFTIDMVFIVIFITLFTFLTQYLKTNDHLTHTIANVGLGLIFFCGLLDFYEDLHILTMLYSAVNNLPIQVDEISLQMQLSMLKFCASYLALFLISFILPNHTFTEKILRFSLMFFFVPIGVLVYTAPQNLHVLFNLIRFVFMCFGFFLLAYNFFKIPPTQYYQTETLA